MEDSYEWHVSFLPLKSNTLFFCNAVGRTILHEYRRSNKPGNAKPKEQLHTSWCNRFQSVLNRNVKYSVKNSEGYLLRWEDYQNLHHVSALNGHCVVPVWEEMNLHTDSGTRYTNTPGFLRVEKFDLNFLKSASGGLLVRKKKQDKRDQKNDQQANAPNYSPVTDYICSLRQAASALCRAWQQRTKQQRAAVQTGSLMCILACYFMWIKQLPSWWIGWVQGSTENLNTVS